MKYSFLVPVYNVEKYLPQCIESMLGQTYRDFEIILVDDGSTDSSGKICDEYKEKYPDIMVLSLRDSNVGGSRNMYGVLKQCRGKYIAILEGDDWWECDD